MTELTVTCTADMGPLTVSVLSPRTDSIEFALSAGSTAKTLSVEPGHYMVIARRPNGSRLRRSTIVGDDAASVSLSDPVGVTPNEFMEREFTRGEVNTSIRSAGSPLSGVFADTLGQARLRLDDVLKRSNENLVAPASITAAADTSSLSLAVWILKEGAWNELGRHRPGDLAAVSGDFIKMRVPAVLPRMLDRHPILAVGLLDASGLGPVVCLPPLADPGELTFVLAGVKVRIADRDATGQQRVPVALFSPGLRPIADLMSSLAAPDTPLAATIWDQVVPGLVPDAGGDVELVLRSLLDKGYHAEALIVAHYLLRFLPKRLPVAGAERLVGALPSAADGPIIAAWAWIQNRPKHADDGEVDAAVSRLVARALARPVSLFARTRTLLFEARHFVERDGSGGAPWRRVAGFRRAGAAAGGLECFWGSSPDRPIFGVDDPVNTGNQTLREQGRSAQ